MPAAMDLLTQGLTVVLTLLVVTIVRELNEWLQGRPSQRPPHVDDSPSESGTGKAEAKTEQSASSTQEESAGKKLETDQGATTLPKKSDAQPTADDDSKKADGGVSPTKAGGPGTSTPVSDGPSGPTDQKPMATSTGGGQTAPQSTGNFGGEIPWPA